MYILLNKILVIGCKYQELVSWRRQKEIEQAQRAITEQEYRMQTWGQMTLGKHRRGLRLRPADGCFCHWRPRKALQHNQHAPGLSIHSPPSYRSGSTLSVSRLHANSFTIAASHDCDSLIKWGECWPSCTVLWEIMMTSGCLVQDSFWCEILHFEVSLNKMTLKIPPNPKMSWFESLERV